MHAWAFSAYSGSQYRFIIHLMHVCLSNSRAGADFTFISQELTFAVGDVIQCVNVTIIDDVAVEAEKVFIVEISSDDVTVVLGSSTSIVSIIDNDGECK